MIKTGLAYRGEACNCLITSLSLSLSLCIPYTPKTRRVQGTGVAGWRHINRCGVKQGHSFYGFWVQNFWQRYELK
jgi:hypothetical protein